jgi:hypothetical protein
MTRRTRSTLIVLTVVAVLAGAEVALNLLKGPEACVQIENPGAEPVNDLVVVCGQSRVKVPTIEPGGTARVFLAGRQVNTLQLNFRQRGNAIGSFQLPGFNPAQMHSGSFKLVLRLRPNEVERFQDDAEPTTSLGKFLRDLWNNTLESLGIRPDVTN